jgi:hypothetical protein
VDPDAERRAQSGDPIAKRASAIKRPSSRVERRQNGVFCD